MAEFRSPGGEAKSDFASVVRATERLWRRHHLTYDQTREIARRVRRLLQLDRPEKRRRAIERLTREEAERLIAQAYKESGKEGLLVKTLLLTGARVSEFAALRVEDFSLGEATIFIRRAKGGKSRYVPVLPELAQELRTYLAGRAAGALFETRARKPYTPRRLQQIVRALASRAGIAKRVYPHLLRHRVATHLLEGGMPLNEIQKFLGHEKLETTQIYAESSSAMIAESYRRALSGASSRSPA